MVATLIADALGVYTAAGIVFATAFVSRGATKMDPIAARSGIAFRVIIAPAAAILWPYLLWRWVRGGT